MLYLLDHDLIVECDYNSNGLDIILNIANNYVFSHIKILRNTNNLYPLPRVKINSLEWAHISCFEDFEHYLKSTIPEYYRVI